MDESEPLPKKRGEDAASSEEKNDDNGSDVSRASIWRFLEKLAVLLIGFLLTTVVGSYLTNQFRKESAKTELEIVAMQVRHRSVDSSLRDNQPAYGQTPL